MTTLEHLGLYTFRAFLAQKDIGAGCASGQAVSKEACDSKATKNSKYEEIDAQNRYALITQLGRVATS